MSPITIYLPLMNCITMASSCYIIPCVFQLLRGRVSAQYVWHAPAASGHMWRSIPPSVARAAIDSDTKRGDMSVPASISNYPILMCRDDTDSADDDTRATYAFLWLLPSLRSVSSLWEASLHKGQNVLFPSATWMLAFMASLIAVIADTYHRSIMR